LALLVAVAVSAALLIDYFQPLPSFCDVGSGCAKVRASGYGSILHVPVPLIGLLAFTAVMAVSLVKSETAVLLTRVLALVGGVAGASLLVVQGLLLHVFCKLCVAVDVSAIVAAVAAIFLSPAKAEESAAAPRWLWPAATAFAMLSPVAWAKFQPSPPVPPEIASLWVPGKLNVVEFADFECPFCRELHPRMTELLREYADHVNFVRLNVPLPSHPDSRTAARAYCCAEDQGKGEAMADALFQSPDLSAQACERLAMSLGLSPATYRACVASPSTDARIDDQFKRAKSAGLAGLPTVWIGDRGFVGIQPLSTLRAAFAEAAHGKPTRLPTALLWAGFATVLAVFGALAMRVRATPTTR
jgi:protein-disulfide isomerase